jgi:hypothetical protein
VAAALVQVHAAAAAAEEQEDVLEVKDQLRQNVAHRANTPPKFRRPASLHAKKPDAWTYVRRLKEDVEIESPAAAAASPTADTVVQRSPEPPKKYTHVCTIAGCFTLLRMSKAGDSWKNDAAMAHLKSRHPDLEFLVAKNKEAVAQEKRKSTLIQSKLFEASSKKPRAEVNATDAEALRANAEAAHGRAEASQALWFIYAKTENNAAEEHF